MPLPILQTGDSDSADLLRLYARAELHAARQLSEEAQLDVGTAFTNPALAPVRIANCVHDASLPSGMAPDVALDEVASHFAAAGTRPRLWVLNTSAPPERARPLADALLGRGYAGHRVEVMHLRRSLPARPATPDRLTILPARAAFRHARQIAEDEARECGVPQIADAKMLHLDDPHTDALVALRGEQAVAVVVVLTVGEVGLIQNLFVRRDHRRRGIGMVMMDRALEICGRSQFRHVLLGVAATNEPAKHLHERCGFEKFAEMINYVSPT